MLTKVNPIGKIVYYALRVEFQMRGSPHLHASIWTSDCPKLTHETKQEYIDFIDNHVQAYLNHMKKQTLNCMNWLQPIKSIITQRLVESIKILLVGLILGSFSPRRQL